MYLGYYMYLNISQGAWVLEETEFKTFALLVCYAA
jgi:hypothetical protein